MQISWWWHKQISVTRLPSFKSDKADSWFIVIFSSLVTFVVLYVYKAYDIQQGISDSGHGLLFRAIVFAFGTFVAFSFCEFFLRDRMLKVNSSVPRIILFRTLEIFIGANIIFLQFNYFWNWNEFYWYGYFLIIFEYTFIVIFPIVFTHLIFRKTKVQEDKLLDFYSENQKSKISILSQALLFIKSEDNYIELFYLSKDKVQSELLRNSLKTIEDAFKDTEYLVRCHRSYMINPSQIVKIIDKKPQPVLDLGHSINIPVSSKYMDSLKSLDLLR